MKMDLVSSVILCEVGPRDGLQNEKTILSKEDKIRLIDQASDAGFPVIEVGSFVSPKAVPQMADTDELFKRIGEIPEGVELRALIPNTRGVQRAIDCGCKKVKLNVSASRMHNLKNLNRTPEESVAGFADCVKMANENKIAISGSISMHSTTLTFSLGSSLFFLLIYLSIFSNCDVILVISFSYK